MSAHAPSAITANTSEITKPRSTRPNGIAFKNTVGPALEVWDGYGDFQLPFDEYIAA